MAEYIERETAVKAILDKENREIKTDYEFCLGLIVASNAVSDVPAADVVPVVRCRDCKHYKQSAVADRKMCYRKDVDDVQVCYDFLPDDGCTYGEREDDERID